MMLVIGLLAHQPPALPSVWDRVYTAAQAERGRAVYDTRCGRCHGADLRGVNGSALAGDAFMLHWEGRTIERLFRKIRDTMPPEAAGALMEREALDKLQRYVANLEAKSIPRKLQVEYRAQTWQPRDRGDKNSTRGI